MKINIKTDLKDNNYTATFSVVNIPADIEEKIKDNGESLLNIGGDITKEITRTIEDVDGEGNPVQETVTETVVLHKQGDKFIKFPSEFPVNRTFSDVMLGGKAKEIAEAYVKTLEARIKIAVDEIKGREDTFSNDRDILL